MTELFASGHIIDAILCFVALEAVGLLVWRARTGRGPKPVPLLCNLAAGAALMLALRAALTGAEWPLVAAFMLGALAAHASELVLRFRGEGRSAGPGAHGRGAGAAPDVLTFPARRRT